MLEGIKRALNSYLFDTHSLGKKARSKLTMPEKHYPIDLSLQEALKNLDSGKQKKAKEEFAALLQQEPENIEFQAGFFCAGWWLNRENSSQLYRSGRPLAFWLMQEWENFTQKVKARGYQSCICFQRTMHFVLNEIASNFRQAFQEEGAASADPNLLKELAICLIQLEDYNNAVDILGYARAKNPHDPRLNFLLGESLCCRNSKKEDIGRGLSYYRDAFLIDLHITEARWIASQVASKIFMKLHQKFQEDLDRTLNWFPAYLMAASFEHSLTHLKRPALKELSLEVQRLLKEKERVVEKYSERLHAALSFYLLTLIYQYTCSENQPHQAREYKDSLKQSSPELYELYRKHIAS